MHEERPFDVGNPGLQGEGSVHAIYGHVVLLLASCVSGFAQGHFHFAGPMSQFLAEGVTPGAVTSGLPFAVVLSDAGATIAPTTFTLQGEGWDGNATLTLTDAKFANGHLTATVHLTNGTRSALEGLRLDLTGATEEYKAKGAQGNDILKTRAQAVGLGSPLLFGDVAKRDAADPQPLRRQHLGLPAGDHHGHGERRAQRPILRRDDCYAG